MQDFISEQVLAGCLLILSSSIFVIAGMLFTGRVIWKWQIGETRAYLLWERSLVITAVLVVTLGLVLLNRLLMAAGDTIFSTLGMTLFFIGTVIIIAAETFALSQKEWAYAPVIVFVVLAFIGQAAFGASILRTGFLPDWTGWATILWNLIWLIILPIARLKDMYYPWLHYAAPLLIGIALLVR